MDIEYVDDVEIPPMEVTYEQTITTDDAILKKKEYSDESISYLIEFIQPKPLDSNTLRSFIDDYLKKLT